MKLIDLKDGLVQVLFWLSLSCFGAFKKSNRARRGEMLLKHNILIDIGDNILILCFHFTIRPCNLFEGIALRRVDPFCFPTKLPPSEKYFR